MRALAALLLIAMLGVSGCSTTLFESLPTGASTGCDPAGRGAGNPSPPNRANASIRDRWRCPPIAAR